MRQLQTVVTRVGLYVCTAMLLAAPAYAAPVVNGGFESGDFTGWTLSGNTGFGTGVCLDGSIFLGSLCSANSGSYAAVSGPYPASGFISQVLATTASTSYDLTFYLRNDNLGGASSNLFNVHWNGGVVHSLVNVPQQGYAQNHPVEPPRHVGEHDPVVRVPESAGWLLPR